MQETLDTLKKELELTENFMDKMELQSRIDDIEITLGIQLPPKPADTPYICEGCSA